ncbi:MAG: amino acid permease [Thermoanaerobaculia bacterium]|nr:amino acid permease [Thermoanaerobaculia bacterium]
MVQARAELSRDLSLFDITMIGVGAMIGAGIFVLTGEAAGVAGPALIVSFALNGLVTLLTAMVYAELGSAIPEAGGGYHWIQEGLPGANAFLAGWMSWFAHAVAGALYALGFRAFLFELLRLTTAMPWDEMGLSLSLGKKIFGLSIALVFAYINYRGASETGMAGNVVTLAKLAVIGAFCFFGLKFMFFPELGPGLGEGGGMGLDQLRPLIPEETGWLGILSAMGLTFIAFEGYEIIVQAGEEVKDPRRNIPKAIFLSLVIVTPIYMLVAFVLVGATVSGQLLEGLQTFGSGVAAELEPGMENWKILRHVGELGLARAATQFVPFGAVLILAGGMLSTMSALNATLFSSTRVAFAMGRDRQLPDRMSEISTKTSTPHFALAATTGLVLLMVAFVPLTTVAAAADIMFLLLFLQVNVAVITLRKKYGDKLAYGYLMPFYPVVPILGIVTKLALAVFMFDHYPEAWWYVLAWLGTGGILFWFYAREREREEEAPRILVERVPVEVGEDAVCIAVPESGSDALLSLGARLARTAERELLLVHNVPVPRQLPLRAGLRHAKRGRETLEEVEGRVGRMADVPVRSILRMAHRPAESIIHTVLEKKPAFLIMGWGGRVTWGERLLGRNVDRVIRRTNCHAIVVEQPSEEEADRVLVPVARPETAPLALGVARSLGRDVEVVLLHLTEAPMSEEDRAEYRRQIYEAISGDGGEAPELEETFRRMGPVEMAFEELSGDVASVIARRGEDFDRIVLGTGEGGWLRRRVFGEISRSVAARAETPVVFVRAREGVFRFGIQQFFQFFRELERVGEEVGEAAGSEDGEG